MTRIISNVKAWLCDIDQEIGYIRKMMKPEVRRRRVGADTPYKWELVYRGEPRVKGRTQTDMWLHHYGNIADVTWRVPAFFGIHSLKLHRAVVTIVARYRRRKLEQVRILEAAHEG